jgi:hypothetical protein
VRNFFSSLKNLQILEITKLSDLQTNKKLSTTKSTAFLAGPSDEVVALSFCGLKVGQVDTVLSSKDAVSLRNLYKKIPSATRGGGGDLIAGFLIAQPFFFNCNI